MTKIQRVYRELRRYLSVVDARRGVVRLVQMTPAEIDALWGRSHSPLRPAPSAEGV